MKSTIYSLSGEKKSEVTLPKIFDAIIRKDIAQRTFESRKYALMQPYSHDPEAGKKHSAAGTISHQRHKWKAQYGKGISRAPRKIMWRRGTQFIWVGAEASSTRGGRRAHGPMLIKRPRKVNQQEAILAVITGIAATANKSYLVERYSSVSDVKINLPLIIESKNDMKAKSFVAFLDKVLGELSHLAIKKKQVRAGKGKLRGRTYKSNAGLLLVKSKDEKISMKIVDVVNASDVQIEDLYPLGRLCIFTEKSLKELEERLK